MNFSEFIGFIITIAAMIYMTIRQMRTAKDEADDEAVVQDEKKEVRELLRSLDIPVEDEVPVAKLPPIPRQRVEKQRPEKIVKIETGKIATVDQHIDSNYASLLDNDLILPAVIPLDYGLPGAPSRGRLLVENLGSAKKMLVIHDIFGPPKGMRGE